MFACLLAASISLQQPVVSGPGVPGLDFSPIKAPLERVANSIEKTMSRIENAPKEMVKFINIPVIAIAVGATMLIMHGIHLHGLAASKANLVTT